MSAFDEQAILICVSEVRASRQTPYTPLKYKHTMMKNVLITFLLLGLSGLASAELPEPPDPRMIANMSVEERIERGKFIRAELSKATPEERKVFRDKFRQKLQSMSPQERQALHEQMHAQWKTMSKEQQEQIRTGRRQMIESLTPEEKAEIKRHREQEFEKMTPEERQKWRDDMHHHSSKK